MRSAADLEAGLETIRHSPRELGTLELIVRRPETGVREVVPVGVLDPGHGLIGDNWSARDPAAPDPHVQVTIMNARAADLVAESRDRWPLAGDQLYVDFDLSTANIPPGTRLRIGSAVIEVSAEPHTGCRKFVTRFGVDAMKFVNSPVGRALNLRGINARVVEAGEIRTGDSVSKVAAPPLAVDGERLRHGTGSHD